MSRTIAFVPALAAGFILSSALSGSALAGCQRYSSTAVSPTKEAAKIAAAADLDVLFLLQALKAKGADTASCKGTELLAECTVRRVGCK